MAEVAEETRNTSTTATNATAAPLAPPPEAERKSPLAVALDKIKGGEKDRSKIEAEVLAAGRPLSPPVSEAKDGKAEAEKAVVAAGGDTVAAIGTSEHNEAGEETTTAETEETTAEATAETTTEGDKAKAASADDPFKPQPGDTKNFQKRINHFKTAVEAEAAARKKAETEAAALKQELEGLRTKFADLPEDAKERIEESIRLRRVIDLQSDPEVVKFDAQIADAEKSIQEALATHPDWEIIKASVERSGGWAAFARSGAKFNQRGADGKATEVTSQQVYRKFMDELAGVDADTIKGLVADQSKAQREKQRFLETEGKKAKEWMAQQKKQRDEQAMATKQRDQVLARATDTMVDKAVEIFAELQDQEVPDTPDASIKKPIVEENKRRAEDRSLLKQIVATPQYRSALDAALQSDDPNSAVEIVGKLAVDSVRSRVLARQNKSLTDEVSRLKAELDNVKTAGRTTRSPGASTTIAAGTKSGPPARNEGESDMAYAIRVKNENQGVSRQTIASWVASTAKR